MDNNIDTIQLDIFSEELNYNEENLFVDFELAETIVIPVSEDFN
tara:strand:- start:425 stop:556 length:132 start_codon:yes stop_codon:yes gene_type:complete